MFENFIHDMRVVQYGMIILTIIINFIIGVFYFRKAVKRHNIDLALAIFMGLYAIVLAYFPTSHYLWNYLGIGWGVLLFVFILKVYFGDIIKEGTTKQRILMVLGILIIVLILLFAPYIKLPEWFDYIPAF